MVVTVEISETIKGSYTKYSKKFIPVWKVHRFIHGIHEI